MQGNNWGILILLTLVVVVYALIRAHMQRDKEDDADAPENAEGRPDGTASIPDGAKYAVPVEIPWAECQGYTGRRDGLTSGRCRRSQVQKRLEDSRWTEAGCFRFS